MPDAAAYTLDPRSATRARATRTYVLVIAAATAISSLVLGRYLAESASWERVPVEVPTYVPEFRGTEGAFNVLAARGDVQGFAILYWDPALERGSAAGNEESSYRAARPLLSYLAWLAMGGRRSLAATGIFLVSWLSAIGAAVAVAALARARGRSVWWGLTPLLLPGGLAALAAGGADLLAVALSATGLLFWPKRRVAGVALLTLAAMSRETALIVPAGLILHGIIVRKRMHLELMTPFLAWIGWAGLLRARYHAWPWESLADRRLGFQVSSILDEPANLLNVLLLLFLIYVGLRRVSYDVLPWIALCSAAFLFVLGPEVLESWGYLARVLLPGYVAGVLAVVGTSREAQPQPIA